MSTDGRFADVDATWLQMHGYASQAEAVGVHVLDLLPPEARAEAESLLSGLLSGARWDSVEIARLHRDGSIRYGSYCARPLFQDGCQVGAEGYLLDLPDVRSALRRELASEPRWAALLGSLSEGVVIVDAVGRIECWNASAERILALRGEQLARRTLADPYWAWVHEDGSPLAGEAHPAMHTLRTAEPQVDVTVGLATPEGPLRWFSINSVPVAEPGQPPSAVVASFRDITTQCAEAAAPAATRRTECDLFDNAVDGICRVDPLTGALLSANPAEARIFGYSSASELLAATAHDLDLLWMNPAARVRFVEALAGTDEVRDYEVHCRRKDGSGVWVSFSARRVVARDDPARSSYFTGFVIDITQRKQAQAQLEAAEEMMGVAQAAARFGAFRWSVQSGETYWSPGKYALFGLDPATIEPSLDAWLENCVCLEGRGRARRDFSRVLDDPAGRLCLQYRTPDGRWMAALGQLYRDADGRPETVTGINIDITAPKHLEQELRLGSEILAHISEGTLMIRLEDLSIIYTNPQLEKMFGYEPGEMVGLSAERLNAATTRSPAEVAQAVADELQSRGCWQGEIENVRKDGTTFWSEAIASAFNHERYGRVSVSVHRDITALKKAQTEKARLEFELHDAQRLESVGRLAGGVAHDFNNLLTVINGYSALLVERLGSDATSRGYAMEIGKAGETAANLASQLLAFSQRQYAEPREIDLNAVIRDTERHFGRTLPPDMPIALELDDRLGHMNADPRQVNQVLMNLLTNARDAMPDGGSLAIRTANVDLDASQAAARPGARPGAYVLVEVSDTGCGMDAETCRRIFEPFFSTKELGQGTGLGLATVHGIVKQNGGWIEVESAPNRGTRFQVYLPRIAPGQAAQQAVPGPDAQRKTLTVLVVEDEPGVRKLTRAVLESDGYSVLEAPEGYTAYELAKRHQGAIELLLSDVILPGMNGREVSEHVMRLHPELKVLFMSGFPADVLGPGGVLGEDSAFLQKPFTADGLLRRVRDVLCED